MLQFADSIQKRVKTYPQAVPKTRMKWYSPKVIKQHKIPVSHTGVTSLLWPSLVRKINEKNKNFCYFSTSNYYQQRHAAHLINFLTIRSSDMWTDKKQKSQNPGLVRQVMECAVMYKKCFFKCCNPLNASSWQYWIVQSYKQIMCFSDTLFFRNSRAQRWTEFMGKNWAE